MGFRRCNRDRIHSPPSPKSVNLSPKSANVLQPRTTIRRKIFDPFDDDDHDGGGGGDQKQAQFVYEMKHREQAPDHTRSTTNNIQPSFNRAQHYPGQDADRPDLDSFWSYVYHSVVDPCCGDLERVFYSSSAKKNHLDSSTTGLLFEEDMVFFKDGTATEHDDESCDDDDDDESTLEGDHDQSFTEENRPFMKTMAEF
ncbi:unnamed protein product [Cylindrotheca closterium]|uniref:Uncharacterized protein n=1 Tax=Cylindrotheca closterium TaxID=2856 RepID=A0AAD2FNZ9_9STRA|nr:unnamed protein product [Cylindrotheca closterium]